MMNLDDFDFDACFKFLKSFRGTRRSMIDPVMLAYLDVKTYLVNNNIENTMDESFPYFDLAQKITHILITEVIVLCQDNIGSDCN